MGQKDNFIRGRHGRVRQKQPQFLPVYSKAVVPLNVHRQNDMTTYMYFIPQSLSNVPLPCHTPVPISVEPPTYNYTHTHIHV